MVRRFAVGLLVLTSLLGCGEDPPPPRQPLPLLPPREIIPVAAPRALATEAAFDLVTARHGATFVWGQPTSLGGGLRLLRLNDLGESLGHERQIVLGGSNGAQIPPDAVELAAASSAGHLGIVWVSREQALLRVLTLRGDADGGRFSPVVDLGVTDMRRVGRRGQVAIGASEDGTMQALYRGRTADCSGATPGSMDCLSVFTHQLGNDTLGEDVPMAVPELCDPAMVGATHADGAWYFGVCAANGGTPAAHVLGLVEEPAYKQPSNLLAGCSPSAITAFDSGAYVSARCGNRIQGVWLGDAGRRSEELNTAPRVECSGDEAVVIVGERRETLRAPRDRIESLLPPSLVPGPSRAVWTGRAVLVAAPIGREVAFRRYECIEGEFLRADTE